MNFIFYLKIFNFIVANVGQFLAHTKRTKFLTQNQHLQLKWLKAANWLIRVAHIVQHSFKLANFVVNIVLLIAPDADSRTLLAVWTIFAAFSTAATMCCSKHQKQV
ncbi:hypothetical protein [Corynebacterium durum]|uniref:Uncharacterized protein n=1 Tax=Corynebacterium durum F0235 TaxID=1035195 RepID=L1MM78_9CORY|nr:hypothetical protein [Corynebacterium durum]EKX92041.1 hypothetical protein HMPREF9997_00325 [Corynebacterium durum F0235]